MKMKHSNINFTKTSIHILRYFIDTYNHDLENIDRNESATSLIDENEITASIIIGDDRTIYNDLHLLLKCKLLTRFPIPGDTTYYALSAIAVEKKHKISQIVFKEDTKEATDELTKWLAKNRVKKKITIDDEDILEKNTTTKHQDNSQDQTSIIIDTSSAGNNGQTSEKCRKKRKHTDKSGPVYKMKDFTPITIVILKHLIDQPGVHIYIKDVAKFVELKHPNRNTLHRHFKFLSEVNLLFKLPNEGRTHRYVLGELATDNSDYIKQTVKKDVEEAIKELSIWLSQKLNPKKQKTDIDDNDILMKDTTNAQDENQSMANITTNLPANMNGQTIEKGNEESNLSERDRTINKTEKRQVDDLKPLGFFQSFEKTPAFPAFSSTAKFNDGSRKGATHAKDEKTRANTMDLGAIAPH